MRKWEREVVSARRRAEIWCSAKRVVDQVVEVVNVLRWRISVLLNMYSADRDGWPLVTGEVGKD